MHKKLTSKRTFTTFLSQNLSFSETSSKYSTYLINKPFLTEKRFKHSSQELTQIEKDFHNLHIEQQQQQHPNSSAPSPTPFSLDNSYDCIMNRIPWYEEYLNDLGEDEDNETSVSSGVTVGNYNSFSIESDYIDEKVIQGKIITNALESEKTLNKYFDVSCKMFPTKA